MKKIIFQGITLLTTDKAQEHSSIHIPTAFMYNVNKVAILLGKHQS